MNKIFSKISNKIAENLFPTYLVTTLATIALFVSTMILTGWNVSTILNPTILLNLTLLSGLIQRFLGGVGLLLNFILISKLLFRILSNFMKGKKKRVKLVKGVLLVLAAGICIYALYRIASALFFTPPINLIDILFNLYGVWAAIIWVYFLPILKRDYQPLESQEGLIDHIQEGFEELKYSLWKGYQKKIKQDYGTVYVAEYERLSEELDGIREQLSGILLLPLAIILLLFPPLMGIVLVLWLRVFSVEKKPFTRGEQILLLLICGGILILSTISFFFVSMTILDIYFDVAYGIGILSGVFLLAYLLIKS
jgi:hypothetical protein